MNANIICNGQFFTISHLPRSRVRLEVNHLKLKTRLQGWSNSYSTRSSLGAQKVIFSGIQPTGVPHLGNYLGALREWSQLQNNATEGTKLLFSIVDLHALTVPQDASQLRKWRKEMFATLLSVGLNPERSTIFYQSAVGDIKNIRNLKHIHWPRQVPTHTELFWVLSTVASMGYLSRMTQWKVGCHRHLHELCAHRTIEVDPV